MHETPNWLVPLRAKLPAIPFAGIFGSSVIADETITIWGGLGQHLVDLHIGILNGGYAGTMKFFASNVRAQGGFSAGVICSSLDEKSDESAFSEILVTDSVLNRLEALIYISDFYIILPGGIGTAVEVSAVLWLTDRGLLPKKRMFFLGDHWRPFLSSLEDNPLNFRNSSSSITKLCTIIATPTAIRSALQLALDECEEAPRQAPM